ncbi:MAG: YgaP family membrane protein [Allorhizobium sp.]
MFTKNVGSADRIVRVILGLAILSLFYFYPNAWWRYYTLIGLVPLLTGLFSFCPLYSMLGMSTCPTKKG